MSLDALEHFAATLTANSNNTLTQHHHHHHHHHHILHKAFLAPLYPNQPCENSPLLSFFSLSEKKQHIVYDVV
jgi:hypothetical protein